MESVEPVSPVACSEASGYPHVPMKPLNLPSDLASCTPQGTWRVAGTRVSIDSVIYAFWAGATPEEICQDFPPSH